MRPDAIQQRRAILSCFHQEPDFAGFLTITANIAHSPLLRWLDESGMAIYLAQRLVELDLAERIDENLHRALQERKDANRHRTSVLLREFERVNAALQGAGVEYAVIKGFTLTPEFCSEPWLRHQSDIDLLMPSPAIDLAINCLGALGYRLEADEGSGEICLAIRSDHIPSAQDFIYDPPRHRHIEIHSDFYQPHCGVSLDVGHDWVKHLESRAMGGVRYPSLDLPHRFLMQVLHVFRHIPSWARVSWLYEIARFVERFGNQEEFWRTADSRLRDHKVRRACGVVCSLVARAFGTRFPGIIQEQWIDRLLEPQVSWIKQHAELWMLSDFETASKTGLLLHRDFAGSKLDWWSFRAARYSKAIRQLRASGNTGPRFLMQRARKHMDYLWDSFRWSARH